ncbi:ATPase [Candidatus Peregrinibacteria bacterium]|nr:MAG: ATPase [Candidatus Peregrinibacteria bacterium]
MNLYTRSIKLGIKNWLFRGKVLIIYGARQVGKTTLCKNIMSELSNDIVSRYYNCEDPLVAENLIDKSADQIFSFFDKASFVILDEAQSLPNIGRIIKIFHDAYPDVQIIATGSSSFDLSNKINEPLTGRSLEFTLYPLSLHEVNENKTHLEKASCLSDRIIFGMYPEIVLANKNDARMLLVDITKKYLFKDVFGFEGIKNSALVYKIIKALAYQIGSEVSFIELSRLVGTSQHTIEKYIDILEKAYIIFRLPAFSTNQRKEIRKSQKIYFYDTGIRNAVINSFDDIELRSDRGALLENVFLLELMKKDNLEGNFSQFYFWRTYDQQEIDIIIQKDNKIEAVEIKWSESKKRSKAPAFFQKTYPDSIFTTLSKNDLLL